jgi:hypothetical protein
VRRTIGQSPSCGFSRRAAEIAVYRFRMSGIGGGSKTGAPDPGNGVGAWADSATAATSATAHAAPTPETKRHLAIHPPRN